MSSCLQSVFMIIIILKQTIDAQPIEKYYTFGFNEKPSACYIEQNGFGVDTSSNSAHCPATSTCWEMAGASLANATLTTSGYHTIIITIDVAGKGLALDDFCYIQYKTLRTSSWSNVNLITKGDAVVLDYQIILPDTNDYNDRQLFYIRLGNSGTEHKDYCYFDNLKLFGIPYSDNPTIDPTIDPTNGPTTDPTTEPTIDPTVGPTMMPTKRTYFPTRAPTSDPTADPTNDPTMDPTNNPSTDPTTDPTIDPTMDSTVNPTSDPTTDPTKEPTQRQLSVVDHPTVSSTFSPTKTASNDNIERNEEITEKTEEPIGIILGISMTAMCLVGIGIGLFCGYIKKQQDMNKDNKIVAISIFEDEGKKNKTTTTTSTEQKVMVEMSNNKMTSSENVDVNIEGVQINNTAIAGNVLIDEFVVADDDDVLSDDIHITAGGLNNEEDIIPIIMKKRNKTEEFGTMLSDDVMVQTLVMDDILDEMEGDNMDYHNNDDIYITPAAVDYMENNNNNNNNDIDDDDDEVLLEVNALNMTDGVEDDIHNNSHHDDDDDDDNDDENDDDDILDEKYTMQ